MGEVTAPPKFKRLTTDKPNRKKRKEMTLQKYILLFTLTTLRFLLWGSYFAFALACTRKSLALRKAVITVMNQSGKGGTAFDPVRVQFERAGLVVRKASI